MEKQLKDPPIDNMFNMKKEAELLVECGYGEQPEFIHEFKDESKCWAIWAMENGIQFVNPYADTIDGRRQLDAIENLLHGMYIQLVDKSKLMVINRSPYNGREKRIERIKWCIEQLSENDK